MDGCGGRLGCSGIGNHHMKVVSLFWKQCGGIAGGSAGEDGKGLLGHANKLGLLLQAVHVSDFNFKKLGRDLRQGETLMVPHVTSRQPKSSILSLISENEGH